MYPKRKAPAVYNLLFPIWLLVWFPSPLWLLLIPGNYLIDWLVLRWSLKGQENVDFFCGSNTWKVCLAGFFSDFVASGFLFGSILLADHMGSEPWGYTLGYALSLNPFAHPLALLATVVAIAIAGLLIYLLDRWVLHHSGLDAAQAKASALKLALFTAPYLFLFPMGLVY